MSFTRVVFRRIPGLVQSMGITGASAVGKRAFPSALSLSNEIGVVSPARTISNVSNEIEVERSKQISWFDWITEPLIKAMNPPEKEITPEETTEREELLTRIQSLYYKKPPEEPGLETYNEAFNLLIKYDDWRGVEALWTMAEAEGVRFDEDTVDKIEDYLLEVRKRSWYDK